MKPIERGTKVMRKVNGTIETATVVECYGTLAHSAVKVNNVYNLADDYYHDCEMRYTWFYDEIEFLDSLQISNPLPFETDTPELCITCNQPLSGIAIGTVNDGFKHVECKS